jgi:hypothetical protein
MTSEDGLQLQLGLVWAVIVVLLLLFILAWAIYGWVKVAKFEGMRGYHDKTLQRINHGPSLRFNTELTDGSQPHYHMDRYAWYDQPGGMGQARGSEYREGMTGWSGDVAQRFNQRDEATAVGLTQADLRQVELPDAEHDAAAARAARAAGVEPMRTYDYSQSYHPGGRIHTHGAAAIRRDGTGAKFNTEHDLFQVAHQL